MIVELFPLLKYFNKRTDAIKCDKYLSFLIVLFRYLNLLMEKDLVALIEISFQFYLARSCESPLKSMAWVHG